MGLQSIFRLNRVPSFKPSHPISNEQMAYALEKEAIQLWVCSFGDCGSDMLIDHFEQHGYIVRGAMYEERGSHFPNPTAVKGAKAIYIYGDIYQSVLSQHHKNILALNLQKASNFNLLGEYDKQDFSNLDITPFLEQFRAWTATNRVGNMSVIQLRYESLWEDWYAVQSFLNIDIPPPEKKESTGHGVSIAQQKNLEHSCEILAREINNFKTTYF